MSTVPDSSQVYTPQPNAGTPYGPTALSNIVLRSSDSIDFYVLRDFLRYVSPFFVDMFDLPATEQNEKKGGLPIIPITESSETLRHLLDFIHPHDCEPQLDNVPLFLNVCKATQKYCMKNIENKLRKRIVTSHLISTEPLRLYAVAIDLGWEEVALIAAQKTSGIPLSILGHAEELRNISGSGFYRFLEYKLRCEKTGPAFTTMPITSFQLMTLSKATTRSGASTLLIPGALATPDPFGSTGKADIVLRSSDSVAFFVIGDIIRMASSTLSNLYDTAMAGGESTDGRIIINVAEDSKVLFQLLCLIHPILAELDIQNCQLFIQVVLAARRLGVTVVETRLRKQAAASPLILTEPLRMYVVASALGWDDMAKSAALNTFFHPLQEMAYTEEFDLITGTDLYRLVAFRFKCANAACNVITGNSDYNTHGPGRWGSSINSDVRHHAPTEQVFEKLRSCPRGSTITEAYYLEDNGLNTERGRISCSTLAKVLRCKREIAVAVEAAVMKACCSSSS